MATQPQKADAGRNYRGFLGRSMVGEEMGKKLRVSRHFRLSDSICNIGQMSADNICYVQLPVGPYTYRQLQIEILANAAIAGKTVTDKGDYIVQTAAWADYIEWVALEINGREVVKFRTAELIAWAAYHNVDMTDGTLPMFFGHPNQFAEDRLQDAYLLGTGNIFSAKLLIKTKPALVAGMKPRITAEWAPVRRPVGFFQGITVNEYTFAGSGKQIVTDVPNGIDFQSIWIVPQGAAQVKGVLLEIDRQIAFECSARAIQANCATYGRDVAALPGLLIDGFRDGKAIGFDALTNSEGERGRGADVRLTLDLTAAGTFRVITVHCGIFADQR